MDKWRNKGYKKVIKRRKYQDIPILLFQAGNDTFVVNEAHNKFRDLAKNCTIVLIDEGKHELYLERDSILHSYLDRVFKFYELPLS